MNDTKASLIFMALSAVLLIGIGLLPESEPIQVPEKAATVATSAVHVIQTSDPVLVKETSAGWKVTVQEY